MKTEIEKTVAIVDLDNGSSYYADKLTNGKYMISKDEEKTEGGKDYDYVIGKLRRIADRTGGVMHIFE